MAISVLLSTIAGTAGAQCVGDCDGSGDLSVGELIVGVNIALGLRELGDCPGFDRNGNGRVDINELLSAVRAALDACPTPAVTSTPTVTATSTPTETATASPTPNLPPQIEPIPIYRTFTGMDVDLPLPVSDPEGATLTCDVTDLPDGADYDEESASILWTPSEDQFGAFNLPFSCTDDAVPPQPAEGEVVFRVSPPDPCLVPTCDPATGCETELVDTAAVCCSGEPLPRVEEPEADCPAGRVLYIGRNERNGFGRLQNCDRLRMSVFAQSGARVRFNIETRCLNTNTPVMMHARMDNESRGKVLEASTGAIFLNHRSDGFDERLALQIPIPQAPYFDLEDSEVNFTVTVTDNDGVSVSGSVRVILTSADVPDLPE